MPKAIVLVPDENLRQEISALLPDYDFVWELNPSQAINDVAALRPSFLLAEPDPTALKIIIALQSSPATRRLPMVAVVQQDHAPQVDALAVIPRAALAERLPDWAVRHGRVWGADYYATLAASCQDAPPPAVLEGIRLFDAREFWEAHEVLEGAWIAARPAPISEVYRSILQVGVAYYQIQQGNYRGAVKMFLRVIQWLDPLPDACQGIDLAQFKQDAAAVRTQLETLGAARIGEFDPSLFKPVPFIRKDDSTCVDF